MSSRSSWKKDELFTELPLKLVIEEIEDQIE